MSRFRTTGIIHHGIFLKITFVMPFASLAGGTRVVADYAAELTARGHEVMVVSQPDNRRRAGILSRLARRRKPARTPTPLLGFLGPRHVILERPRPVTDADVPDADAVIATWWETAEWVARLSPAKGRKFHFLQGYEMMPHLPLKRVAATFHLPLRKFAVSGYVRDMVQKNHGIDGIGILPNSVNLSLFDAPPRQRNATLRVGFLYASLLHKNLPLALASLRAARTVLPDLEALSFGGPPVPEHPLPDWVRYHRNPPQTELAQLYAACDLWLFTSHQEGFGLPILEAMACRTPVLATRAGAAPDLIDGRNGRLLDPDPQAFAAEIARINAMPGEAWRGFSDAAWHTARNHRVGPATDRLLAFLNAG